MSGSSRVGVLLATYGAPQGADDLPAYLERVRGGKAPTDELVAEFRRRYERIGWSPLVRITLAQAAALERALRAEGDFRVAAGMRFSPPSLGDAVASLTSAGARRIVGLVLSPQWSPLLMAGYARAIEEAVSSLREPVPFTACGAWHREEAFLGALAERVREALTKAGPAVPIVMTAHSLPRRVFDAEPEYVAQLRETAELLATRLGLPAHRWRWAYQSAGHTAEEWLRPDLKEIFPTLAAQGHREVLVVPVQFLADHLEVLYDLDVAAAEEARAAGLRFARIAMPNTQHAFIRALAAVVRREVGALPTANGEAASRQDEDAVSRRP